MPLAERRAARQTVDIKALIPGSFRLLSPPQGFFSGPQTLGFPRGLSVFCVVRRAGFILPVRDLCKRRENVAAARRASHPPRGGAVSRERARVGRRLEHAAVYPTLSHDSNQHSRLRCIT